MYAFCCKDSDFYPLYGTKGRIVAATFPTFQACGKSCKHNALRTKKRRAARHCRHKKIITLMAQVPFGAAKRHFPALRNGLSGRPEQAVWQGKKAPARNLLATSHLGEETPWRANAPFFFTKWHGRSSAATARAGTKKGIPARESLLSRFKECPISRDELPLTGKRQRKCHTLCRHRD